MKLRSAFFVTTLHIYVFAYSSPPVSTGNTFQDLPRLRETVDDTERYTECLQKNGAVSKIY
jgi:hypothetical protein